MLNERLYPGRGLEAEVFRQIADKEVVARLEFAMKVTPAKRLTHRKLNKVSNDESKVPFCVVERRASAMRTEGTVFRGLLAVHWRR